MAYASAAGSRARSRSMLASSHSKNGRSRIAPYLITSASPAASSRSGRVSRVDVSAITASGWWKAPIMFFPSGWFTPVLPPTDESTWARSVVGTWMNGTPR